MRKLIALRPQGRFQMNFTFNCSWENMIVIFDQATGQRLFSSNSHNSGDPRSWTIQSPLTSTSYQVLEVVGFHKKSPPDSSEPWHESAWRQLEINTTPTEGLTIEVIGFEDAGDGDFNDARVAITHF